MKTTFSAYCCKGMRRVLFGLTTALGVALLIYGVRQTSADPTEFNPRVVIRRSFPAITNPPVVTAAEADEQLLDEELVLGVTAGDKSRAYPINMLTGPQREIINDTLGGHAIAATW